MLKSWTVAWTNHHNIMNMGSQNLVHDNYYYRCLKMIDYLFNKSLSDLINNLLQLQCNTICYIKSYIMLRTHYFIITRLSIIMHKIIPIWKYHSNMPNHYKITLTKVIESLPALWGWNLLENMFSPQMKLYHLFDSLQ